MTKLQNLTQSIIDNVSKVIVGKEKVIELLVVSLLSEGHVLIDDVPGVGKTMLARSIAVTVGGSFKRIQCTPDLLPNDITGVSIYNQAMQAFEFMHGPVFVNILLADEINRATPRTQSALLEAMQEQQVSVDGTTHALPRPFIVIATQNPVEYEGTFPLPEAQLDRFMMQIAMGYPEPTEEKQILINLLQEHPIETLEQTVQLEDILGARQDIWQVHVDETLHEYIVALVNATRKHTDITLGASPRAALALVKASQALAAVRGRYHVLPDDVKYLFKPVLAHRLIMKPESILRGRTATKILDDILNSVSIPLVAADESL